MTGPVGRRDVVGAGVVEDEDVVVVAVFVGAWAVVVEEGWVDVIVVVLAWVDDFREVVYTGIVVGGASGGYAAGRGRSV